MPPPLAGKPPFATDDPDSIFSDQPKAVRNLRKPHIDATAPGGARQSAYTAFDTYFAGNGPDTHASSMGNVERGFMNAGSDHDHSSNERGRFHPSKQISSRIEQVSDKHQVLYAAAVGGSPSTASRPSYERDGYNSTQEPMRQPHSQESTIIRTVKQPQPVVHSRGTDLHMSQYSEPSGPPGTTNSMPNGHLGRPSGYQDGIRPVAAPTPVHSRPPQVAFMQGPAHGVAQLNLNSQGNPHYIPGHSGPVMRNPQPLPPPQSPITPVLVRPRKETNAIRFEEKGQILRGDSEETLLPRGTGGKGDEFWRRFSMVARADAKSGSNKSAWLKKTESGSTRLSTWVWIFGIICIIAIGGGIGVGWYFTHNKPAAQPVAIGGSADESSTSVSAQPTAVSTRATRVTAAPVPTNTSIHNRRDLIELVPSLTPGLQSLPPSPAAHRRSLVGRMPH